MNLVERRISDRKILKLIRQWLKAGDMEAGTMQVGKPGLGYLTVAGKHILKSTGYMVEKKRGKGRVPGKIWGRSGGHL